jgi:hypothetical protein
VSDIAQFREPTIRTMAVPTDIFGVLVAPIHWQ